MVPAVHEEVFEHWPLIRRVFEHSTCADPNGEVHRLTAIGCIKLMRLVGLLVEAAPPGRRRAKQAETARAEGLEPPLNVQPLLAEYDLLEAMEASREQVVNRESGISPNRAHFVELLLRVADAHCDELSGRDPQSQATDAPLAQAFRALIETCERGATSCLGAMGCWARG